MGRIQSQASGAWSPWPPATAPACSAWEAPPTGAEEDSERTFEAILSVEPTVVREAATAAAAIVEPVDTELAETARAQLEGLVDADGETPAALRHRDHHADPHHPRLSTRCVLLGPPWG